MFIYLHSPFSVTAKQEGPQFRMTAGFLGHRIEPKLRGKAFEAMQLTLALFGLFCVFATPAGEMVDASSWKFVAIYKKTGSQQTLA